MAQCGCSKIARATISVLRRVSELRGGLRAVEVLGYAPCNVIAMATAYVRVRRCTNVYIDYRTLHVPNSMYPVS